MTWIERAAPGDRFADFCLWDYPPVAAPTGGLRSSTLLWAFLDAAGWPAEVAECCRAMRSALGPFQIVWGAKQRAGALAVELYFYDYARLQRRVSLARILSALQPYAACDLAVSERCPYFMFSLDLTPEVLAARRLEAVSIYVGNPGSSVSSGLCYALTADGLQLTNLYAFFDRAAQLDEIRAKLSCSAHLDLDGTWPDILLRPALMHCGIVVVANKRGNDGLYFSRLRLRGFLDFLCGSGLPQAFIDFVMAHRGSLDHLVFDIGYDYRVVEGRVEIIKTAIYGLL